MRGILAGAFALIVLQVLVANPRATNAVGGVATGAGKAVNWFLDPNVPAIPDLTQKAKTSSATSGSSSSSSTGVNPSSLGSPPGNTGGGFLPGEV